MVVPQKLQWWYWSAGVVDFFSFFNFLKNHSIMKVRSGTIILSLQREQTCRAWSNIRVGGNINEEHVSTLLLSSIFSTLYSICLNSSSSWYFFDQLLIYAFVLWNKTVAAAFTGLVCWHGFASSCGFEHLCSCLILVSATHHAVPKCSKAKSQQRNLQRNNKPKKRSTKPSSHLPWHLCRLGLANHSSRRTCSSVVHTLSAASNGSNVEFGLTSLPLSTCALPFVSECFCSLRRDTNVRKRDLGHGGLHSSISGHSVTLSWVPACLSIVSISEEISQCFCRWWCLLPSTEMTNLECVGALATSLASDTWWLIFHEEKWSRPVGHETQSLWITVVPSAQCCTCETRPKAMCIVFFISACHLLSFLWG